MKLRSTMMDSPLTIARILSHGQSRNHASVVTEVHPDDTQNRATFAEVGHRCAAISAALEKLGIGEGDAVGMMLSNRFESFELMLAIPAMGAVIHPINVQLSQSMILATIGSIEKSVLVTGPSALEYLARHHTRFPSLRHVILIGGDVEDVEPEGWEGVSVHSYEQLLDGMPSHREWPEMDENAPAVVCHTSGTTGMPKSVVYSHRAIYLHAMTMGAADGMAMTAQDTVLSMVPLFHVMGWGLPYATMMFGNDLVLARSTSAETGSQTAALERGVSATEPTAIACTPVHFAEFLRAIDERRELLENLDRVILGGSSVPTALSDKIAADYDFRLIHAWGMTETGPLGTASSTLRDGHPMSQGRFNAQMFARVIDLSGTPLRGQTGFGELEVAGPYVTGSYFNSDADQDRSFDDGWFRTGDIAHVTDDGYLTIIDRLTDAILSGGEWISSVELENAVMELPEVAEAACIGVPDSHWGQRPLCVVCMHPWTDPVAPDDLYAALTSVPEWKRPDHWAFLDQIPRTSVGKFDKRTLRRWYAQGRFDVSSTSRG